MMGAIKSESPGDFVGICNHEGKVRESFASKTRDKAAALKFIKAAMGNDTAGPKLS
jgi:hypothetical protein